MSEDSMLQRVLEPEVMDTIEEARDYDAMDHSQVNALFVSDFLAAWKQPAESSAKILDLGTGTAQIPIELGKRHRSVRVHGIDLAKQMLELGVKNVQAAGLQDRITLELIDAKKLPFADGSFDAAISNSIVHHIPEPAAVFTEVVRIVRPGGMVFFRDLLRPRDDAAVRHLVQTYAGNENAHQRQMFEDSLRAALALGEVRELIGALGFAAESVQATSDRHWTWQARRPGEPT